MERKLATIRKILEILPIENADLIELVKIDGWQCVTKKNEFHVGDLCLYCEVDSVLPIRPEFEFLRKSCYKKMWDGTEGFRIKTVRLRGTLSQGIAFPLSVAFTSNPNATRNFTVGTDYAEELGIKKYEQYTPAQLMGEIKGPFPSHIFPRSDEERVQNLPWVLEKYKDTIFYVSEKLNGSSASFAIYENEFHVCSRNIELKESENNTFWRVAREMKIEEKLRAMGEDIALQGELVGEGIQKNMYNLKGQTIFFFNAYNIKEHRYLNLKEFDNFVRVDLMLPTVSILSDSYMLPDTIEEILSHAEAPSVMNVNQTREGIVVRPIEEIYDPEMPYNGRLSFKVISNKFLLKNEE